MIEHDSLKIIAQYSNEKKNSKFVLKKKASSF